jgi:hypothetical protein
MMMMNLAINIFGLKNECGKIRVVRCQTNGEKEKCAASPLRFQEANSTVSRVIKSNDSAETFCLCRPRIGVPNPREVKIIFTIGSMAALPVPTMISKRKAAPALSSRHSRHSCLIRGSFVPRAV